MMRLALLEPDTYLRDYEAVREREHGEFERLARVRDHLEAEYPSLWDPSKDPAKDFDEDDETPKRYQALVLRMDSLGARLSRHLTEIALVRLKIAEADIKSGALLPAPAFMTLFSDLNEVVLRYVSDSDRRRLQYDMEKLRGEFLQRHPGVLSAIDAASGVAPRELPAVGN